MKNDEQYSEPRTIVLLGIPFHDLTMSETLDWIGHLIQQRRPSYFVTANLDFAAQASQDIELQRILVEAELVLCDGAPLLWISKLTGRPLRERVAGSDLIPKLAARAALEGWRIFLLGGDSESLQRATEKLTLKHPGIIITGTYSPPFAPLHEYDHEEIATRIKTAAPDILLVAFGCPKQEKWIYKHYRELGVPCCIGIGATIDFLAGKVRRAPGWIATMGLEWVVRLLQEPRRLAGRYLKDVFFLVSQLLRERKAFPNANKKVVHKTTTEPLGTNDVEVLFWEGPVTAGTLARLATPSFSKPFIIDLSRVTLIDSSGLGHLLGIIRKAWSRETVGCFAAPSKEVHSILQITRLERVLPVEKTMLSALQLIYHEQSGLIHPPLVDEENKRLMMVMPARMMHDHASECQSTLIAEWKNHPELRNLTLDFRETQLMDSSGLGFVLKCKHLVRERDGVMNLLNVSSNVSNVIKIARMQHYLGIAE